MPDRPAPLHPIILPRAPEGRDTRRSICRPDVVGAQLRKDKVSPSAQGVEPSRPPEKWGGISSPSIEQPLSKSGYLAPKRFPILRGGLMMGSLENRRGECLKFVPVPQGAQRLYQSLNEFCVVLKRRTPVDAKCLSLVGKLRCMTERTREA